MWTSKRKIETLSLWGKSWYRKESLKILVGIGKRSSRGLQHQGTLCIGWGGGGVIVELQFRLAIIEM